VRKNISLGKNPIKKSRSVSSYDFFALLEHVTFHHPMQGVFHPESSHRPFQSQQSQLETPIPSGSVHRPKFCFIASGVRRMLLFATTESSLDLRESRSTTAKIFAWASSSRWCSYLYRIHPPRKSALLSLSGFANCSAWIFVCRLRRKIVGQNRIGSID